MRFTRDWGGNCLPIHLCLLDRECWRDYREFYAPMRLHLHFLKHEDGFPVFFNVWGRRRHDRWFSSLQWEPVVNAPRKSGAGELAGEEAMH